MRSSLLTKEHTFAPKRLRFGLPRDRPRDAEKVRPKATTLAFSARPMQRDNFRVTISNIEPPNARIARAR